MEAFYWDLANTTAMGEYLTRTEGKFIARELRAQPWIRTIVDIGGGSGRFSVPLKSAGFDPCVFDVNPVPLAALGRRQPAVPAVLMSTRVQEWPLASDRADCLLCIEVPVVDDDAFLQQCHRVLRAGGLLIFTMLNRESYKGVAKAVVHRGRQTEYHGETYQHSLRGMRRRLRQSGFSVLRQQGFQWVPAERAANGKIVPLGAGLERLLGLHRLAAISPWVIIAAQKQ
jgi:SAM-dependent methyltransferase